MSNEYRVGVRDGAVVIDDPLAPGVETWSGTTGPADDAAFHPASTSDDPKAITPSLKSPDQMAPGTRRWRRISRR